MTNENKKIETAAKPAKTIAAAGGTKEPTQAVPFNANNITKARAQAIFDRMGTGRNNSVYISRREDDQLAREWRRLVSDARKAGIPVVAGMDHTYWIADATDYIDRMVMIDQAERLEGMAREASKAAAGIREALAAHRAEARSEGYVPDMQWWV